MSKQATQPTKPSDAEVAEFQKRLAKLEQSDHKNTRVSRYETFEMNRAYAEHFADADALYLTLNTHNSSTEQSLDKLIKTLFTNTEIRTVGAEQRKKRANRIERLVAIETTTTRTHAHIVINPKSLDTKLLKLRLRLS